MGCNGVNVGFGGVFEEVEVLGGGVRLLGGVVYSLDNDLLVELHFLGVGGGGGFSHVVDGFYDDIPGEGGAGGYLWTFGAVLFVVVVYHVDVPTVQQPEPALLNSEVPQVALEAIHALLIKADLPSPTQRSVWHCILNTNWLSISIQSCRIHGIFISRRGGIPSRNILYDDSACTSPTGTI